MKIDEQFLLSKGWKLSHKTEVYINMYMGKPFEETAHLTYYYHGKLTISVNDRSMCEDLMSNQLIDINVSTQEEYEWIESRINL